MAAGEGENVIRTLLAPDSILEGPFWPERVRVISSRNIGSKVEVSCVGLNSNKFYSNILTKTDLAKVRRVDLGRKDFKRMRRLSSFA